MLPRTFRKGFRAPIMTEADFTENDRIMTTLSVLNRRGA